MAEHQRVGVIVTRAILYGLQAVDQDDKDFFTADLTEVKMSHFLLVTAGDCVVQRRVATILGV